MGAEVRAGGEQATPVSANNSESDHLEEIQVLEDAD